MSEYEKAYEALHQPDVDEIMEQNFTEKQRTILDDIRQQLEESVKEGYMTKIEADHIADEWLRRWGYDI